MKKPYKRAYIEIGNVCNLACSFCPTLDRPVAVMDAAAFSHVLNEVRPYTDFIYLHLMGEPLLHPQLAEFLSLGHEMGLKIQLTTNGTLIEQRADLLIRAQSLRQINISLSSFEANHKATELEGYLEPILDFIKRVQEEGGPIVSLRLWNLDSEGVKGENQLNQRFFKRIGEGLSCDLDFAEALSQSGSVKVMPGVYLNSAEKFTWPDISREPHQTEVYCYGLKDHFGILADGTVVPCCLDHSGKIALGNVFNTPLKQILTSPRAEAMRTGFQQRKAVEALCQTCGYAGRF